MILSEKVILILLTLIFIIINVYIRYNKISIKTLMNMTEGFTVSMKPNKYYMTNLNNSSEFNSLEDDVKDELMSMYNIYESTELKEFNDNTTKHNLSVDYPIF